MTQSSHGTPRSRRSARRVGISLGAVFGVIVLAGLIVLVPVTRATAPAARACLTVPALATPGTSPAQQELREYEPELRLNSSERELPVTFSALADLPGAALRRADGRVIAGGGQRWSRLRFLGAGKYADGEPVLSRDHITVSPDWGAWVSLLANQCDFGGDVTYARFLPGSHGYSYLEYGYFWLFNESVPEDPGSWLASFKHHEGDIKWVIVRIYHGVPDAVLGSVHTGNKVDRWDAVQKDGTHPVVFPSWGTHEILFTPSMNWALYQGGALPDITDGKGLRLLPTMVNVGNAVQDHYGWWLWRGAWGSIPALWTRPVWNNPAGFFPK